MSDRRQQVLDRTPRYLNPGYLNLTPEVGEELNLMKVGEKTWAEGFLSQCGTRVLFGLSKIVTVHNLTEIIFLAQAWNSELRVEISAESGTKVFYLRPRFGMNAICMCGLKSENVIVEVQLLNSRRRLLLLRGPKSHLLIEASSRLESVLDMSNLGYMNSLPKTLLEVSLGSEPHPLKLYMIETPYCKGDHTRSLPIELDCRWCHSKEACSC
jgi:hypothetical protein